MKYAPGGVVMVNPILQGISRLRAENLLNLVWGKDYPGDVRTVDVHVRRLREKVEANPSEPKFVHTKWGVGYYYYQK